VLAVLGLALVAPTPADAADLSAGVQAVATTATATVPQAQATVGRTVGRAGDDVSTAAQPAARILTETAGRARQAAEPELQSAVRTVASSASVVSGEAGGGPRLPGAPPSSAAATPPPEAPVGVGGHARSARDNARGPRPGRGAPGDLSRAGRAAPPVDLTSYAGPAAPARPGAGRFTRRPATLRGADDPPPGPDPGSSAVGGAAVSGLSASFYFGGMAALASLLCLAGPALCRRLSIRPAICPPAAFVASRERPG
jgi:hypothetical protein